MGCLAGSIWLQLARSGCSGRPGSLDEAVLVAPGRFGWLDLAALGTPGRRFCCAWAVFSLISLRRGNVWSRSPWLLQFGCSARCRAPWLPRFGALGALLGDLGTLLRVSWALLGRSGVPMGRFGVALDALGLLLGVLAGSIWPQLARSGCPWRPCWLDLALLGALTDSIWLLWSLLATLAGYRKPKNIQLFDCLPRCSLPRCCLPCVS